MTFGRTLSTTLSFTLFFPLLVFSADADIFISEVQIAGTNTEDEFIELYNPKSDVFSLDGLKLCRKTSTGTLSQIKSFSSKNTIPAKGFFLFANSDGIFTAMPSDADTKSSALSANNSIAIVDSCSTEHPPMRIIDSVAWGSGKIFSENTFLQAENIPTSKSLIRNLQTLEWSISDDPSPTNSCDNKKCPEIIEEEKIPIDISLRINEVFPNPFTKGEDDEWIELYNFGSDDIALDNFTLSDATKKPYTFPTNTILKAKHFLLLFRKDSDIALNNTNEEVTLSNTSNNIISEISYGKTIEGASLNYTPSGYRWSKILTPGTENILGNAPETKEKDIPDTAYLDVLTTFSATGKDGDGDAVKYTWDFGDGHKSYKGETTHRYAKEGKYEGTLTVTDGTESVVTHFTVEVEKYEAPKVRMTTLVPNPAGKDTDTEYITIENRSKKSVDLLGWSIATGWKKLVNHPIRESFVIPKKSKRDITHAFSAFTLPNEKGRIELRSPDGETVQKLKYNLKGKSAEENARLVKEKGKKWEWMLNQETGSEEQRTTQTADAPPAGGTTAVLNLEEEQLQKDTETITQRKNRGEILLSIETNAQEEMKRLISYGTNIETPAVILALAPRVAGASDEISLTGQDNTDTNLDINALINDWLARE